MSLQGDEDEIDDAWADAQSELCVLAKKSGCPRHAFSLGLWGPSHPLPSPAHALLPHTHHTTPPF